jgi:hypothetical protein
MVYLVTCSILLRIFESNLGSSLVLSTAFSSKGGKFSRFFAVCSVTVTVSVAVFVGGVGPAQAEEPPAGNVTAAALYNNGYYVENNTTEILTLKKESTRQYPELNEIVDFFYGKYWDSYGNGFESYPTEVILPGQTGYFAIPMYVYYGHTYDLTDLIYTTPEGKEVVLQANVSYAWNVGVLTFLGDNSVCSYDAGSCNVRPSTGYGKEKQTVFTVK